MTEKVKLPKAVCDALDELTNYEFYKSRPEVLFVEIYNHNERIKDRFPALYHPEFNFENIDIMRALLLGYEPELTVEQEALKKLFEKNYFGLMHYEHIHRNAIRETLCILGIKHDWLEGDAE